MPRSENRLAARRPSARDGGGPGGSPSTRTKARRALRDQDPGCLEPMVCKQRRVDAAREVAEILECVLDPLLHLAEQLALSGGICSREALRHARLDGERHQLLLRAVVQVAFEAPTLLVLGGDESLAVPASDWRWPCRLRFVGVGAALRAPTVSSCSASLA
jgi:hypothetical protein